MICGKCRRRLPDDSNFCQYCGSRVEKDPVTSNEMNPENHIKKPETNYGYGFQMDSNANFLDDRARKPIEFQSNEAVQARQMDRPIQQNYKYNDPVPSHTPQKKRKESQRRFCSRCGSMIDSETKVCTGCGRQYFRGIRFHKYTATIIVLALSIIAVSIFCIMQHAETQELQGTISVLNREIKDRDLLIKQLANQIEHGDVEENSDWKKIQFFDRYAEIVSNDGTNIYHKYGCSVLDTSKGFWIINTGEAQKDYRECPYCH